MLVYEDNSGAIEWATGGAAKNYSRRHMDIRYHYVMDMICRGQIEVIKNSTEHMDAAFLTKPLRPTSFTANLHILYMLT